MSDQITSCIVLVVDRLGSGFLAPYGNTWVETPALNWLASRSHVYEHCIADSPDLLEGYAAISQKSFAALNSRFDSTCLVTDETELLQGSYAASFDDLVQVASTDPSDPATTPAETITALVLAAAGDWLQARPQGKTHFVWVHCGALDRHWDAPTHLRRQFADEDDPLPPDFVNAPQMQLPANYDPDELLGYVHAYAGEVAAFDDTLGDFLDRVHRLPQDHLFALTALRGFPLGEHQRIGGVNVHAETTRLPLIVHNPQTAPRRLQTLTQPSQLAFHLSRAFGVNSAEPTTDRALTQGSAGSSIHTPAWSLVESMERAAPLLYAKPDDRWECNDVAEVCPDIVKQLQRVRENLQQHRSDESVALMALDEELVERWE